MCLNSYNNQGCTAILKYFSKFSVLHAIENIQLLMLTGLMCAYMHSFLWEFYHCLWNLHAVQIHENCDQVEQK